MFMLGGAPRAREVLSVSGFPDLPETFFTEIQKYPDSAILILDPGCLRQQSAP
jgi:hypothetical protein